MKAVTKAISCCIFLFGSISIAYADNKIDYIHAADSLYQKDISQEGILQRDRDSLLVVYIKHFVDETNNHDLALEAFGDSPYFNGEEIRRKIKEDLEERRENITRVKRQLKDIYEYDEEIVSELESDAAQTYQRYNTCRVTTAMHSRNCGLIVDDYNRIVRRLKRAESVLNKNIRKYNDKITKYINTQNKEHRELVAGFNDLIKYSNNKKDELLDAFKGWSQANKKDEAMMRNSLANIDDFITGNNYTKKNAQLAETYLTYLVEKEHMEEAQKYLYALGFKEDNTKENSIKAEDLDKDEIIARVKGAIENYADFESEFKEGYEISEIMHLIILPMNGYERNELIVYAKYQYYALSSNDSGIDMRRFDLHDRPSPYKVSKMYDYMSAEKIFSGAQSVDEHALEVIFEEEVIETTETD